MPIAQGNPMAAFTAGRELVPPGAGGTTLGPFVKLLTERVNQMVSSKAEVGKAVAIEKGKLGAQQEATRANLQTFQNVVSGGQPSGGGGSFPPGSSMHFNPTTGEMTYDVQLNPKLPETGAASIATAAAVRPQIAQLRQLVEASGQAEFIIAQQPQWLAGAERGVAGFLLPGNKGVSQTFERAQWVKGLVDRIKFAGFTFGGRQLTQMEAAVVIDLVNPIGKPKSLAQADLQTVETLLALMDAAVRQGRNSEADFVKILKQANVTVPPELLAQVQGPPGELVGTGASSDAGYIKQGTDEHGQRWGWRSDGTKERIP